MTSPAIAPIAFTMGDAAGIGPELLARLHADGLPEPAIVYGDAGALRRAVAQLGLDIDVVDADAPAALTASGRPCLSVRNRWQPLPVTLPMGQVHPAAGRGAYEYLCHAIDDAVAGRVRAIVTAPLNKAAMQLGGIDQPGHTEILAQRTGTRDYAMMLVNPELRVLLVTIHEPLSAVSGLITIDREYRAIRLAAKACRQFGLPQPRVAVAGLNPHAGEEGHFGHEDAEIIAPAVALARAQGIDASGPWPGDTVFMRARRGDFDIVVAQYHDQGLIPVKYLGVDHGVNVTVGLPFVRTSVDHGTAYDIAGQGIADPTSLRTAYELARTMSAPR